MCTVTYIPTSKGFVFTSNRDEQATRKTKTPTLYKENGVSLFYPKDIVAGGTWIGLSEHNRLVCLLNGGFVYHNPKIKFAKSRGIVVKTMLTSTDLESTLKNVDLNGVAPFTLVVVDWKNTSKAFELVWCKGTKHVTQLDVSKPYIWSSSTLYTDEMKIQRKNWFTEDVLSQKKITKRRVLSFHQNESLGSVAIAPKMKRDVVETISTTMVVKEDEEIGMEYFDYVEDRKYNYEDIFSEVNI